MAQTSSDVYQGHLVKESGHIPFFFLPEHVAGFRSFPSTPRAAPVFPARSALGGVTEPSLGRGQGSVCRRPAPGFKALF